MLTGLNHLHMTLGVILLIISIYLPILAIQLKGTNLEGVKKKARTGLILVRTANFLIIFSLITGGWMFFSGYPFTPMIILVFILFLGIAAMLGILQKNLRLINDGLSKGESIEAHRKKVMTLGIILIVLILTIIGVKQALYL